ncbi:hypothetical protein D9757_003849 [Collybiopsis confluens]|uniref:3-beta hydroxysteroid dehydrogenase/isomerase domain-containing protein n=1 Tax=Collybiopsis confluens TaxID=2823264 RepID=A0A8H5HV21_9AGAR|nr:hypothetical protein D9757_003849 [Collybiopsis confluens]
MAYAVALYAVVAAFVSALLLVAYISINDAALGRIPTRVAEAAPENKRWRKADFEEVSKRLDENPIRIEDALPPKTGRRYIVVGGAGFLGGWIIQHLLKRGEPPSNIRIVDLRPPTRLDFQSGPASQIPFVKADITEPDQVVAAFKAAWPPLSSSSNSEITVFHTAAVIRFYERHPSLLPLSKINVVGAENVIKASQAVGASILIYTSSGSVVQRSIRLLLFPWVEKEPRNFVQVLGDQEPSELPSTLDGFTCCYSFTKLEAETMVRKADKSFSGSKETTARTLRTGCLRPVNAIYGPGADLYEFMLKNGHDNYSFFPNIITSNIYVENCSLAHLCYEQRLIELTTTTSTTTPPDIGGQMFTVTDSEQPIFWSDIYDAISHFTNNKCRNKVLKPTLLIVAAIVIEQYYLLRYRLSSSRFPPLAFIGTRILPPLSGNLQSLQPSVTMLAHTHLFMDDSRARLSPGKGGLGYKASWSALEGLYKTIKQFETEGSLRPASTAAGFGHGK